LHGNSAAIVVSPLATGFEEVCWDNQGLPLKTKLLSFAFGSSAMQRLT
jgi:hypothetical protein